MLKLTSYKKIDLPIVIGSLFFVYLLLRIFLMPISNDEAISVDMHAAYITCHFASSLTFENTIE